MSQNIIYKYTFVSKKPYYESFVYRDVFQIIPHELSLKSENQLMDYHYLNVIEINLNRFYEVIYESVDISKIFFNCQKLESNHEKIFSLSEASPLFIKDHYISLPKWILLNILTVFSNYKHFDYTDEISEGWYKKIPFKDSEFEWGKKWLPEDGIRILSFTSFSEYVELVDRANYLKQVSESKEKVNFPDDIYKKLDTFFNLKEEIRECFLASVVLFNQAISSHTRFGSLSIVSFVSSIENLVQFEHRNNAIAKCDHCHQEIYRVTKKFNDFVNSNTVGFYSQNELKQMLGDVYAKRSSIVHKGRLFPHEKSSPLWTENYFDFCIMEKGCESLTRFILNSWISKHYTQ